MTTNAFVGLGATFNRWNSATSQWDAISDINGINGPSMTRETVDVTTMDSLGGYREFISALRDGGDVSLSMNFQADTYTTMKDDFDSDTEQLYSIVLPDSNNTELQFNGLVTELPLEIPVDDKVTCDVTIKISGQTTLSSVDLIESVETLSLISKANGTQLANIGLPTTVVCTLDDSTTSAIPVVWDTGTPMFDGDTADTYVFVGTLVPATGIRNPDQLTASQSVAIAT